MKQTKHLSAIILTISLLFSFSCKKQSQSEGRFSDIQIEQYLQAPDENYSPEDLKGQAVLLEFWATWCAPCVAKIPHLNQLAEQFEDKPIKFISVTTEKEDVVEHFLKRNKIQGWIGLDTNRSVFEAFDVKTIPKTLLFYPDGELAAVTRANEVTKDVLNRLLEHEPLNVEEEVRTMSGSKQKKDDDEDPAFYRINIDTTDGEFGTGRFGKTRLEYDAISIRDYIARACEIPSFRVFGQDTLLSQNLEVDIQTPGLEENEFNQILKNSIENALQIEVKREVQPKEVYVIRSPNGVTKGLRKDDAKISHFSYDEGVFAASSAPINKLVKRIHDVTNEIIIDETGLNEKYSWTVKYDTTNKMSVLDSLESNLGLNVEKETREIEVIQVE
ncbi:MAG: TIGR03435 family protein [Bacteroidales bacterium]|nr:TIGR03435 family protein [Bacteroidales bacterium]MCF8337498.1 TIGR03435 family protein [Bacteroidales bacterium]